MKKGSILFIIICLLICVIPFAGMTVYTTEETTENKTLAEFPKWMEDGKWNVDFFEELTDYFNDHFAFRQQLVSVDAEIQSKIFKVSNVDTVVVGTDNWLYYKDTVKDYLAQDTMNDRQVFNTVHNISLLQQYVKKQGAEFLFTISPNKNSLYGENMPYYFSYSTGKEKNMDLLTPAMKEKEIEYVDLFSVFEKQRETLYLKRDSHWNNKGAVLAYNTLMNRLEWAHPTYEDVDVLRTKTEYGDLNKMVYPLTARPEWNYNYQYDSTWEYKTTDEKSPVIETECGEGEGSLLMFRDSFGNSLLPLMAQKFESAAFVSSIPYGIEQYMSAYNPDVVIVEKVERNMDEYMSMPPVMQGPETEMEDNLDVLLETTATLQVKETEDAADYYLVSGYLQADRIPEDTRIFVRVGDGEKRYVYEAFTTSTPKSDYAYRLYLKKENMQGKGFVDMNGISMDVIIEQNGVFSLVKRK